MELGKPVREIHVEPIHIPVPTRMPEPQPEPVPVSVPAQPERVPA